MTAPSAKITYTFSCHCGKVAGSFEAEKPIAEGLECNCSMCSKTAAVMGFVAPADFKLDRGSDELTDYQFNKHAVHHTFCKTCGLRPFAKGTYGEVTMYMINLRYVDGLDISTLKINHHDGKSSS